MRKLLIALESEELRQALIQKLDGQFIVHACADGFQAQKALQDFHPDILVLDLMLPHIDGISLLRQAQEAGQKPVTLVLLTFISDFILSALRKYDVAYIMSSPCSLGALSGQILELASTLEGSAQPQKASALPSNIGALLLELGLSPKLDGYKYLLQAIPLYMQDPTQALTKELYAAVGHSCSKSINQVERSMRNAIHNAWCQADMAVWRRYFPAAPDGIVPRPCVGDFITRIAAHLSQQTSSKLA